MLDFHDLQVEMSGCKGPITTFIIEPFIPHNEEFYLNIVSERLGCSISFSECGGIEIEENWDKVYLDVTYFIQLYTLLCFSSCRTMICQWCFLLSRLRQSLSQQVFL